MAKKKRYNCKHCDYSVLSTNPSVLAQHYRKNHPRLAAKWNPGGQPRKPNGKAPPTGLPLVEARPVPRRKPTPTIAYCPSCGEHLTAWHREGAR